MWYVMLKATYANSELEKFQTKSDLRLLPIKTHFYSQYLDKIKKVHGLLQYPVQPKPKKPRDFFLFTDFEHDWITIVGKYLRQLTPPKYLVVMQLVCENLCVIREHGLELRQNVQSPFSKNFLGLLAKASTHAEFAQALKTGLV